MGRKKEVWTPLEILGHINFENARAYRDIVPIQALWPSLRSKLIKSGVTDHGNAPSNWWQFAWSKVERPYSAVEDFSAVDLLDDFDIADANESDRPGDVEREATAMRVEREAFYASLDGAEREATAVSVAREAFYASLDDAEREALRAYLSSYLYLDPPYVPEYADPLPGYGAEQREWLCAYAEAFCARQHNVPVSPEWPNLAESLIKEGVLPKAIRTKEGGRFDSTTIGNLSKLQWRKIRWHIVAHDLGPFDFVDLDGVERLMARLGVEQEPGGGYGAVEVRAAIPRKVGPKHPENLEPNSHFRGGIDWREVRPLADYILTHPAGPFNEALQSHRLEDDISKPFALAVKATIEAEKERIKAKNRTKSANNGAIDETDPRFKAAKEGYEIAKAHQVDLDRIRAARRDNTRRLLDQDEGLARFCHTVLGAPRFRSGRITKTNTFEKFRGPMLEMAFTKLWDRANPNHRNPATSQEILARLNSYPELRRLNSWKRVLYGDPPTWGEILKGRRVSEKVLKRKRAQEEASERRRANKEITHT